MKKRLLSLLLVLCIVTSMIPAMTIESDAIIGSILKVGFKVCKSVIKGTIVTVKNLDHYNGNVGKAVLGQFKNIGADLTGLDIGEDYGSGEEGQQEVITSVDLEEIKKSMQTISDKLDETNNAIYQLESTVNSGMQELSNQLSDLYKEVNKLSGTVSDTAQLNRYYTYLTEFFSFFNQYYEGISYYDEQLTYAMKGNRSEKYIKNLFDQFHHLENVEYTGNLYSAVTKLGKYIRGEYVSADGGSVIDVMSQYYIQAYKLTHAGCTDVQARAAAASAIEDMVGYIYYAYCTGVYYEDAVLMYQSSYMDRNGIEEYTTDFGTCISTDQISDRYMSISDDALLTAGSLLGSLLSNYPDGTLEMPYFMSRESDSELTEGITRHVSTQGFTIQNPTPDSDDITAKPVAYLPDLATGLPDYFSEDLQDAFSGITTYQIASATNKLNIYDGHILEAGDGYGTVNLNACVGDQTIFTIPVNVAKHERKSSTAAKDAIFGEGTEDFPYIIRTYKDLLVMQEAPSAHYILATDIDCGGANWTSFDFSGVLDGNDYTIENLNVNDGLGFFNTLTGTVRNLYLIGVTVSKSLTTSDNAALAAGIFAGTVTGNGLIYRCAAWDSSVSARIYTDSSSGVYGFTFAYAGGIAGTVSDGASILSCVAENVKVDSFAMDGGTGGIVGNLKDATVSDCFVLIYENTKTFTGQNVGGIVGMAEGAFTIEDGIICLKYDPFQGTYNGVIVGYADVENGGKISGQFYAVDRTHNIGELNQGYCVFDTSKVKLYGSSDYHASSYPEVFAARYELSSYLTKKETDFMADFDDEYSSGSLFFKNRSFSRTTTITTYEDGQYFNLAGMAPYYESEFFDISYSVPLYKLSLSGITYKTPVIEGAQARIYSFSESGYTYTMHIAERHFWVQVTTKEPTCTENGSSVLMCVDCGETKDAKTLAPLGHKVVVDPAVSPNCKSDGLSEGSHCERCGEVFTKQEVVVSTDDHGHTIVKGYPATCTENGLTDKDWCEGCGLVHTDAQIIPATGHTMKEYAIVEATCDGGGIYQEKCEICDAYGDFKSVPALGHTWKKTVVDPTHTEVGYTVYTCESCGESYKGDYLAPIGHTFGKSTVTKAATCTAEGELTYSCSCGNGHTVSIPKTSHELVSEVTASTCTEIGYTTVSCEHCGYSYIEAYTAPLGHDFDSDSADCTHGAVCKLCGYTEASGEDHDWENGTCRTCGCVCEHTGGTATCSHRAVCSICGAEYGELDPDNHFDLDYIASRAATTDAEGSVEHWYCVDCGKSYRDGHGKFELSENDIVTAKLPQNVGMILLWVLPFVLNIAAIVVVIIVTSKRKKEDAVPSKVI